MSERYVKSVIGPELPPLVEGALVRRFYPEKGTPINGPTALDCLWSEHNSLMVPLAQRDDGEALAAINSEADEIKVSRVINRKKTCIVLGCYAVVDGKRVGTSIPCPPNLTKKQIKETLHYGELSLRREIAKYLASKDRATPIELIADLAAQRLAQRDK